MRTKKQPARKRMPRNWKEKFKAEVPQLHTVSGSKCFSQDYNSAPGVPVFPHAVNSQEFANGMRNFKAGIDGLLGVPVPNEDLVTLASNRFKEIQELTAKLNGLEDEVLFLRSIIKRLVA